jgi:hypothetical protein
MKNFTSAARLTVLVLSATGILTGCKPADAPQFSPIPGTYTGPQLVAMSTPTFGATIVYTDDGSAPSCVKQHGTIYTQPVPVQKNTVLRAMACSLLRAESLITTGIYAIKPPEQGRRTDVLACRRHVHQHAVGHHRHGHGRCVHPLHEPTASPPPAPSARHTPARSKSRSR